MKVLTRLFSVGTSFSACAAVGEMTGPLINHQSSLTFLEASSFFAGRCLNATGANDDADFGYIHAMISF